MAKSCTIKRVCKRSRFIFLDEPNSALDPISEFEMSKMSLKFLENKIGIIIVHKFNNFCKKMDKIIVMKDGEIVQSGTHTTLMKTSHIYQKLYDIQTNFKN